MSLVSVVLNGLSEAMVLFLIASGLSLVFGLMGIVNFAHGAFYALGGYFAVTLLGFHESFWLALFIAPFIVVFVGIITEYVLFRPVYDQEPIFQVLLTFGLAIVIEEVIILMWGRNTHGISPPEMLRGPTDLIVATYPTYRVFTILLGAVVAIGLFFFIERTVYGIVIQAGTLDSEMVEAMGVNIHRIFTVMFGVGVGISAIGGVVIGPQTGIYPAMGIEIIVLAFIVVVVGGIGSISGSLIGSLIVGLLSAFGGFYIGQYLEVLLFGLMVVILIVRPTGLFGQEGVLES